VPIPTGLSLSDVTATLASLRAWGEIQGVPGPQLDAILDRARDALERKPGDSPPPFNGPRAPPLLNP